MPKYRAKPVEFEAFRFGYHEAPEWFAVMCEAQGAWVHATGEFAVLTSANDDLRTNKGDWIVKGVDEYAFPCSDTLFNILYERCEDEAETPAETTSAPVDEADGA